MDPSVLTTAEEFLEKLDRRSADFAVRRPEWGAPEWIFRGQADAEWELLPSVLRGANRKRTWEMQVDHEQRLLLNFFDAAQTYGIAVPEYSQSMHMEYNRVMLPRVKQAAHGSADWPLTELLSLAALAQHYGIPTRLLDWSYDPLVAAYMAAVEVTRWQKDARVRPPPKHSDYLAVWAYDVLFTQLQNELIRVHGDGKEPYVRLVGAPSAAIPNLAAQKGLFTAVMVRQEAAEEPKAICLTDVLASLADEGQVGVVLKKYVLPHREAPRLLRLLSKEFICAASMFPGYGGTAEYAFREKGWHEP